MYGADRQDRWKGAGGAALLVAAIGYGLVSGLDVPIARRLVEDLKVMTVLPDRPPPKPDPVPAPRQAQKRKEGAAAPPNLRSKATEIVAPPPVLRPPSPPPVVVATVARAGSDATAGAAPIAGPGTGSGGQGDGTGSGDGGDGDGGGGGIAPVKVKDMDFLKLPRELVESDVAGRVTMGLTVRTDGKVSNCSILRSSGNRALDEATCALAVRQIRFRPARDRAGHKIAEDITYIQTWDKYGRDPAPPGPDER